jgi:hypothetical protein
MVYSDDNGAYVFDEVPVGDYTVEVAPPLIFRAVTAIEVAVALLEAPVEVNFELELSAGTASVSHYWWLMEIEKILGTRPGVPALTADAVGGFLQDIHNHFYARSDGHAIEVAEVTLIGDPARALSFGDLVTFVFFESPYDGSYQAKARRSLMTCLLNIAAGYTSQNAIVSADGATLSQAISYFSNRYLTGSSAGIFEAQLYLKNIWQNVTIPAGVIPLSTPNVMFKPESGHGSLPDAFVLAQNYPNPFNPITTIEYGVPANSHVQIEIFNVLGQTVRGLVNEQKAAGRFEVIWDCTDDGGRAVVSGVYFYRITAGSYTESKKMLLLK